MTTRKMQDGRDMTVWWYTSDRFKTPKQVCEWLAHVKMLPGFEPKSIILTDIDPEKWNNTSAILSPEADAVAIYVAFMSGSIEEMTMSGEYKNTIVTFGSRLYPGEHPKLAITMYHKDKDLFYEVEGFAFEGETCTTV